MLSIRILVISLVIFFTSSNYVFAQQVTNLDNQLTECSASYLFGAAFQDDPTAKSTLEKASNLSLRVANAYSNTPLQQLIKMRDASLASLNNGFDQILKTNDKDRILAWGNANGARNNKCTVLLQPLVERIKK